MNASGCHLLALIVAVTAGIVIYVRHPAVGTLERCLLAVLPLAVVGVVVEVVISLAHLPFWIWNGARLAPAFALAKGFKIYNLPGSGAALGFFYGPLSPLAYLPATLFAVPSHAILMGGILNLLYFFVPIAWIQQRSRRARGRGRAWQWAGFLLFFQFCGTSNALAYSAFTVHSDAPSIGFGAAACAVLYGRRNLLDWRPLILSALLAGIAIWVKVVVASLPFALLLYLYLAHGRTVMWRYLCCLCGAAVVLSVPLVLWFGPAELIYNLVTRFFDLARAPEQLVARLGPSMPLTSAVIDVLQSSFIPVVIIALSTGVWWQSAAKTSRSISRLRQWTADNHWSLLVLAGLSMIPIALPHRFVPGGDENALSPVLYLLVAAATLALSEMSSRGDRSSPGPAFARMAMLVCLLGLTWSQWPTPADLEEKLAAFPDNPQDGVYRLIQKKPDRVYFPDFPLAALLGTGQLYHFSQGIIELELAGHPLSPRQLQAYMPANPEVVVLMPYWVGAIEKYFPEFTERSQNQTGLFVFRRSVPGSPPVEIR